MAPPLRYVAWALALALVVANLPAAPAIEAAFTDITGNWAREAIESLADRGIVSGYPDHTFRPDAPVTRAEFATMIASSFILPEAEDVTFIDTGSHWAKDAIHALAGAGYFEGYPDRRFRPDQPVTRAEAAAALVRVLGVGDENWFANGGAPTFSDVPPTHWAYPHVEAAAYLNLFPPFLRGRLEPDEGLTRADAAWMLYQALRLGRTSGTITLLDDATGLITVRTELDRLRDFRTGERVAVVRNDRRATVADLREGDEVFVLSDRFGNPLLIKATGAAYNIGQQLTEYLRMTLTPDDIRAIVGGDWTTVGAKAKDVLHQYLLRTGATEEEAYALLNQDWSTLGEALRLRLRDILAESLDVSAELAEAVLKQDWNAARELAEIELSQQLINYLLNASAGDTPVATGSRGSTAATAEPGTQATSTGNSLASRS